MLTWRVTYYPGGRKRITFFGNNPSGRKRLTIIIPPSRSHGRNNFKSATLSPGRTGKPAPQDFVSDQGPQTKRSCK